MLDKVKKNWNLLHFMFTKRTKAQGCHMVRKSGKTKKNDKCQVKMGGFCKKSGNLFKKPQILSVQIYLIPFISKPSISKNFIKNSLKSD